MDSEELIIRTDRHSIYRHYLQMKKPVIEAMASEREGRSVTLSPKLLGMFSILLYYNDKFKHTDVQVRAKLLMSKEIMNEVTSFLKISQGQYRTYMSMLRRYGLIDRESNNINPEYSIHPNGNYIFTLKFLISDEK